MNQFGTNVLNWHPLRGAYAKVSTSGILLSKKMDFIERQVTVTVITSDD